MKTTNHKPQTICLALSLTLALFLTSCNKADSINEFHNPLANPHEGPPAGNPNGNYPVPLEAAPENVSNPDHVIGNGTPESCTAEAFIEAVAQGGTIVFDIVSI